MSSGTLLGLFAETPLHPGAGQSAEVVDLPVAREGATGLPQIPDTGLKGAIRQWAEDKWPIEALEGGSKVETARAAENKARLNRLFGAPDSGAGVMLLGSARLLCLPVRRLDGPYAWVTTTYLLERLRRDARRCGISLNLPNPQPADDALPELLVDKADGSTMFLEEFAFQPVQYDEMEKVREAIAPLLNADDATKERILSQLAIMSDAEFAWYAANALPVNARNVLGENKISENLWYEETIPPDALFYTLILPRNAAARPACDDLLKTLVEDEFMQVGGNETVGQGWVALAKVEGERDAE